MGKIDRRLVAGVGLGALVCAAPFAISKGGEAALGRELAKAGFSAGSVNVSLTGAVTIRDLARGGLTIGLVQSASGWALVSPAQAQAGGYTIENVSVTVNSAKIDIPKVLISGANFSKEDITKVFAFDKEMPGRVKTLNAKQISIPEMRLTATLPEIETISYIFRDLTADDIVNGKVGRMGIGSTSFTAPVKGKKGNQKGEIGRSEVKGFDLVQASRVYFDTAQPGEKAGTLYDSYVVEGMKSSVQDTAAVEMEFGRMTSNAVRAKPLSSKSLEAVVTELVRQAAETKGKPDKKPDPKQSAQIFSMLSELFESFEDDGMTGEKISIIVGDKGKPAASFLLDKFEGTYGTATKPSGFRLSGMSFKGPDVSGRLGEYSIEGFSYAPTFKAMAEAVANGDTEFKSVDPRKLIPKLGTSTFKGFEIDVPDPKAPKGIKPERINFKLGNFSTALKDQIAGIPTKIDIVIDNLALKLPQNSADPNIQQLKALGYTALDMSARLTTNWNEQTKQFNLADFSVGGADMGKVQLKADIGNIGREVFESPPNMVQIALMGATAKSVNLSVENAGLVDKILALQARAQNSTPENLRKELSGMVKMMLPAMLGNAPEAQTLADAVAKFLQQPKSLNIQVTAKNPRGIGLPEVATVKEPAKALELVNINAAAQ